MAGVRTLARGVGVAAAALVLLACSDGDDEPLDPVTLEGIGDGEASPAEDGQGPADVADEPEESDGADEGEDRGDDPASASERTVQVAGAGAVGIALSDGVLRLVDVVPADGWRERSRDVDDDGIEVALVRDAGGEATLAVERDGQGIRLTYDLEAGPVDAGTLPLGAAGELVLAIPAGELVLEELRLARGWEVVEEDRGDDEVELELASGGQRLEIDVELDDGALAVDVSYDSGRL